MTRTNPDQQQRRQQQHDAQDLGAEDCCALPDLSEAALLQNLCRRFNQGQIYTYIAHVLVAINPNQDIPGLYGPQAMQPYLQRCAPGSRPPPHPYAMAAVALRGLRRGEGQSIVISGESGAGKTETAKIILSFIQRNVRTSPAGSTAGSGHATERNILAVGRVLESFGNAKTSRNHNSSRFGKLLLLRLRPGQQGQEELTAQTTTFLLEASRAASRPSSERSFHIFYELFEGSSEEERKVLGLKAFARDHALLAFEPATPSASSTAPMPSARQQEEAQRQRDVTSYRELQNALRMLRLKTEDEQGVWQVLAAIVHLGDLLFRKQNNPSAGFSPGPDKFSSSMWVAHLLGLDVERLQQLIATKVMHIRGDNPVKAARPPAQMQSLLQSLIVTLYKRLFTRLVGLMNISLGTCFVANGAKFDLGAELALLDIYGFENLECNSLEQLLINLTNERLQQFFEERCLRAEEQLYIREGLPCHPLVLEDRNKIFKVVQTALKCLDDFGLQRWRGFEVTDERFCSAVLGRIETGNLLRPAQTRLRRLRPPAGGSQHNPAFTVQHFAGEVCYAEAGWLDRNEGGASQDIEELLQSSSKQFFRRLADGGIKKADAGSRPGNGAPKQQKQFYSTSKQHLQDLNALMNTLGGANSVQFIRCFRPNHHQIPSAVNADYVLQQLHTSGAVQLVRLMHQGFPARLDLKKVASRFAAALPSTIRWSGERTAAQALMLSLRVPASDFSLGVSQLFLKAGYLPLLEELIQGSLKLDTATLVAARSLILRNRWKTAAVAARCASRLAALARSARQRRLRRLWRRGIASVLFIVRCQGLARKTREEKRRRRLESFLFRSTLALVFVNRLKRRVQQHREASQQPSVISVSSASQSQTIPATLESQDPGQNLVQARSGIAKRPISHRPVASPARSEAYFAPMTPDKDEVAAEAPTTRRVTFPSALGVESAAAGSSEFRAVQQSLFGNNGQPGPVRASVENLFALRRWQELRPKLPEKRSAPTGGFSSSSQDSPVPLQQPAKRWRLW